jgi:TatD DNase family protein
VIDTHAHLEMCDERPEDVVAAAEEAGGSRILAIGRDQAVALAGGIPGVWAVVGVHPHEAATSPTRVLSCATWSAGRASSRSASAASTSTATTRLATPAAGVRRQIEVANEVGLPLVIHTRRRRGDVRDARGGRGAGRPALLRLGRAARRRARARVPRVVRRERGLPKAEDLREAARRVPDDRILAETDAPYLAPPPHRGRPNQPAYVMRTLEALAGQRGVDPAVLEGQIDANATRGFRL